MVAVPILPQAGDEITALWGQQVADIVARLVDPRFFQTANPTVPANSGGPTSSLAITFATPFVNVPRIVASITSNTGLYAVSGCSNVSVTGFTVQTRNMNTGNNHTSAIGITYYAVDLTYLRA